MNIILIIIVATTFFALFVWLLLRQTKSDLKDMSEKYPESMKVPTPRWYPIVVKVLIGFLLLILVALFTSYLTLRQSATLMMLIVFVLAALPTYLMRRYEEEQDINPAQRASEHLIKRMKPIVIIQVIGICLLIFGFIVNYFYIRPKINQLNNEIYIPAGLPPIK